MKNGNTMAFPVQDHDGQGTLDAQPGLTKRELFAAMAMQGLLSDGSPGVPVEVSEAQSTDGSTVGSVMAAWHRSIAGNAVGYADALLAALEASDE